MKFTNNVPNATDVMVFGTRGTLTLSGYYEEGQTGNATNGNLSFKLGGEEKLRTGAPPLGTGINLLLNQRLFQAAALVNIGLQFKYEGSVVAGINASGSLLLKNRLTNIPANPGTNSTAYTTQSVVYALDGLDYSSFPNDQYNVFQNPTNRYTTRTIDLSDFISQLGSTSGLSANDWPFAVTGVPINGLIRIPTGAGRFPLAIFAHGNHSPLENSTPGYIYLCELLATHGIISATIDANFLNGRLSGENAARAILHLEHIKQFRVWDSTPGHPLQDKVDLQRVMIIGHSRGGEAVAHASNFNNKDNIVPKEGSPDVPLNDTGPRPLGPYHFGIKSVIALAPTEGQYKALEPFYPPTDAPSVVEDPYLVIHGSRDGDVYNFPGYLTYDRAQPTDNNDPLIAPNGIKSLLYIFGANHNYFNTVWLTNDGPATITRPQQEQIAKVYIGATAQAQLLNNSRYLDQLKNSLAFFGQNWLPNTITLVNQFQDNQRKLFQDFENISNLRLTLPVTGTVETGNIEALKEYFNLGSLKFLYEATGGLRLRWQHSGENYSITLNPDQDARNYQYLVFRVGQSPRLASPENLNVPGKDQRFTVEVSDNSHTATLLISAWQAIPYPDDPSANKVKYWRTRGKTLEPKMVMQTFRIPLGPLQIAHVDLQHLREIKFLFNKNNSGIVYVDDIQLSL